MSVLVVGKSNQKNKFLKLNVIMLSLILAIFDALLKRSDISPLFLLFHMISMDHFVKHLLLIFLTDIFSKLDVCSLFSLHVLDLCSFGIVHIQMRSCLKVHIVNCGLEVH